VIVRDDDRARLEAIVGDRNQRRKHVQRAQIVLLSAAWLAVAEVARQASVSRPAVWRSRRAGATAWGRGESDGPATACLQSSKGACCTRGSPGDPASQTTRSLGLLGSHGGVPGPDLQEYVGSRA
jgi:hypothetical protein